MSKTTKKEIIKSALLLLKAEGPESLTQTRVSKLVGVSQGHLTYYFPKKNDLWKATAEAAFNELKETLNDNLNSESDIEKLFASFSEKKEHTHVYVSLCLRAQNDDVISLMLRDYFTEVSEIVESKFPECGQMFLVLLWGMGIWELVGHQNSKTNDKFEQIAKCAGMLKQQNKDHNDGLTMSATSFS